MGTEAVQGYNQGVVNRPTGRGGTHRPPLHQLGTIWNPELLRANGRQTSSTVCHPFVAIAEVIKKPV